MRQATRSLIRSYGIVSAFIFLAGFLFPPMIFQSNPADYLMRAVYSGLFTLLVSWIFLISGRVIRHGINRSESQTQFLPEKEGGEYGKRSGASKDK